MDLLIIALALGILTMILFVNVLPRLGRLEGRQTALEARQVAQAAQLNRIETNTAISAEVSRQLATRAQLPFAGGTTWNIDQVNAGRDSSLGSTFTGGPA